VSNGLSGLAASMRERARSALADDHLLRAARWRESVIGFDRAPL